MKNDYQKKSYAGFHGWLFFAAVLLFACSFYPTQFIQKDRVQTIGMMILLLIDFLWLLMLASESIYWTGLVKYEEAAQADTKRRRIYVFRQLLMFFLGTAAYMIYCSVPGLAGAEIKDSIAAGVCICVPAVMAMQVKL